MIGTGELATPRWANNALSSSASSNDVPSIPAQYRRESQPNSGLGIDSTSPPKEDSLLSLDSFAQFDFDSSMTAALAASLTVPDQSPPKAEHQVNDAPAKREYRQSAPAPPRSSAWEEPQPVFSPGSARSRIYARRQERQAMMNEQSEASPPNSAGPYSVKKTPPQTTPKSKHSPSTTHHDILRQFAPKDFSHLPPSPSTASIDHFLRGSGSVNSFANFATPKVSRSESGNVYRKDLDPGREEALRKLDGLSNTPAKRTPKAKSQGSGSSGTPKKSPSTDIASPRGSSFILPTPSDPPLPKQEKVDSPLSNWVDLAEDLPVAQSTAPKRLSEPAELTPKKDIPDTHRSKRDSASSASLAGTPNSRESAPTSATTSTSSKANRRVSESSMTSQEMEVPEINVPPVPPLPSSFRSQQFDSPEVQSTPEIPSSEDLYSPSSETSSISARPKTMSKKWSFSSALNLLSHQSSPGSPSMSDEAQWSEIAASPPPSCRESTTPMGQNLTLPKAGSSRRLTPSSIPFFRRTSTSSISNASSVPSSASTSTIPTAPPTSAKSTTSTGARKSVLGMSIPSVLRGSSKRTVSHQLPPTVEINAEPAQPQYASTGWTGRKRGNTITMNDAPRSAPPASLADEQPSRSYVRAPPLPSPMTSPPQEPLSPVSPPTSSQGPTPPSQAQHPPSQIPKPDPRLLKHKSSGDGQRYPGSETLSKPHLPSIAGSPARASPALHHAPSVSSLRDKDASIRESPRNLPSATPTKIPRAIRPTESPARGSMPPPTHGSSKGHSHKTPATSASISEFGHIHSTPRQVTSSSHRAHLLAPMSARTDRRPEKQRDALVRQVGGQVIPPSRRHLPLPPPSSSSTVTAPTASSMAKRTSRDGRSIPAPGSRAGSGQGSDGQRTPSESGAIKPSKSLHTKLSTASNSRLPSSSSVGALSSKTSLVDTPSPMEDDEALADAEMAAYVKRRQARHAAGKKEDLADINGFPEDIAPSSAISQRAYISKNLANMSDYERKEVLDYDEIYYTPRSRIRRGPQPDGKYYNYGYDDERGDYVVVAGDHLCYRYEVVGVLGKGSFGQVLQCRDHKTGQSTAIKIIRNKSRFHKQALVEVKILKQLVDWDPEDRHFMVRMTDHFYFRGHLCIVTEMLSINLYELIKANQFAGFTPVLIRRFTVQMLASLQLLRSHRVVHCDLKPENILLCHPCKSGIKVIDFGSSCHESEKGE